MNKATPANVQISRPLPSRLRSGSAIFAFSAIAVLAFGTAGCTPPSESELLAKAKVALAAGDEPTARIHLMNLLQRNAENVEARVQLADLDLDAGNSIAAEAGYRRAANLRAGDARILAGEAQAVAQQGRYEEALKLLQPDVAGPAADRARLLGLRGTLLMHAGDLRGARDALNKALALAPDDPDRITEMAQLEVRANNGGEADRRIAQALAIDPDHVLALLARGSRQSSAQQFGAAEATFQHAAELAEARHQRQAHLSALLALAEVQLLRHRTGPAGKTIALLNGIAPDVPPVRFLRASLASQSGDDRKAIGELLEILRDSPDNLPARRLLGLSYARTSQWNTAESYLSSVAAQNPDDAAVREALAAVRAQRETRIDGGLLPGAKADKPVAQRKRSLTLAAAQEMAYGRPLEALEYFRQAETEFPEDARLALGTALALLDSGQLDEAVKKLQRDTGPGTAAARNSMLISAYLRKGDKKRALSLAKDLVLKSPGQSWTHDLLAAVLVAEGRAAEARASLHRALAIDSADAFALESLVPMELAAGNSGAAETLLAHAPADSVPVMLLRGMVALQNGDARTAMSLGKAALKQDPRSADGHNLLGLAHLASGSPVAAIRHFETAGLLAPKVPVYALNLAMAYLGAGNLEAANNAAAQARALGANAPALAELDFRLLVAARDLPAAEKQLAKVTPREPQSTTRLLLTAELRQAQGKPAAAADALSAAFAAAPTKLLAIKTALARRAAGRADAIAPLRQWQQRAGPDADILVTIGNIELGAGDRDAAKKHFEEALKADPGHVQALNNLAWIYNESRDPRALGLAERAYRAAPAEPPVLDTVGWVRLAAGKPAAALDVLSKAASSAPDDPEIQYHLAMALIRNERPVEARQLLEGILRSSADFPSRAAAADQLNRLGHG